MSDEPAEKKLAEATAQRLREGTFFRPFLGLLCVFGSLAGFAALFYIKIPDENKDAMMFALGIVFGWGSNVVSSEYGATATGRKAAESAIRQLDEGVKK